MCCMYKISYNILSRSVRGTDGALEIETRSERTGQVSTQICSPSLAYNRPNV
jgi:hypothetical protein